jgi:transposase InsO family protein
MSVRRAIAEADLASLNVAGFCREHGISREAFYARRRRFEAEGEAGLESRSRAPHRVANRTSVEVEDLIISIRKDLAERGRDAGIGSIHDQLARLLPAGEVCSESTIWRVLTRRGFIDPEPKKAPGRSWQQFAAERVNECWQMDSTHWALADGTDVEIINCLDDCSRFALRSLATAGCTLASAWTTVTDAASVHGWPERLLTDNGSAFGPRFQDNLAALGVGLRHSRPYHPQTCGKVERFHQTLKRWLTAHDPAATIAELQALLDEFVADYNHDRPHRSLGRRTPATVFATTPRSGPANQPLTGSTQVFRNQVYDSVVWAGRFRITVGAAHNHQTATIVLTGPACHVFIAGHLVRRLTIDPTRTDQRLYTRRGSPQ